MKDQASSPMIAKTLLLLFVLMIFGIFLMKPPITTSVANLQEERVLENTIPKEVPIKIKIKKEKEKSFKDLKNEKWAREFELELTNTGDKPIYYLDILMVTDVRAVDGHRIVFPLQYGRVGLGDIISKALPEDVPIKPGETYVLKIHKGQVPAWELGQREENRPQPKHMRLELQLLSFGDGTGYFGNQPYSRQSVLENSTQRTEPSGLGPAGWLTNKGGPRSKTTSIAEIAGTLPANFLDWQSLKDSIPQGVDQVNVSCGLFDYCVGIIPYAAYVCHDCPNQNRPGLDSSGLCKELVFDKIDCYVGGEKYFCQTITVYDCGFGPGPTPVPTSTPAPAPCLYCSDPKRYWTGGLFQCIQPDLRHQSDPKIRQLLSSNVPVTAAATANVSAGV